MPPTRPEFLSVIIKTGYGLIEPFILCKASLSFCATRSHVTRLKSACVRVSLEARNRPMRSERKIANGTWQRFFFFSRQEIVQLQQRANGFRATNKQALTTNNKSSGGKRRKIRGSHIFAGRIFLRNVFFVKYEFQKFSFENIYQL